MAEPSIKKGSDHFFNKIYSGTGQGQKVGQFVPFTDSGTISNSVMFARADTPKLARTPSSNGNRKTYTISYWYKPSNLGTRRAVFSSDTSGSDYFYWEFDASNKIDLAQYSGPALRLQTNRTFENTGRFYHFLLAVDTTQSTASNRLKLYVDGDQITSFAVETYPSQDLDTKVNSTSYPMAVGSFNSLTSLCTGGYLAEYNFVDGTALTPSTFGLTDTSTGRWIPKSLTGITYGTNGFRMTFANTAGQTLGDDTSGNGNDFTVTNLDARDKSVNTPTNNIPTMTPYDPDLGASFLSQGGTRIRYSGTNVGYPFIHNGINPNSGKWYAEVRSLSDSGGSVYSFGCYNIEDLKYYSSGNYWNGYQVSNGDGSGAGCFLQNDGNSIMATSRFDGYSSVGHTSGSAAGAVYGIALDLDNRIMTTYNNDGSEIGKITIPPGPVTFSACAVDTPSTDGWDWNFGDNGTFNGTETAGGNADADGNGNFYHSVPSGYKMLIEDNMTDPGVAQPDLVWIKNRDAGDSNQLYDSSRGVLQSIATDSTAVETTVLDGLQNFRQGGFEIEDDVSVNTDSEGYVAWNWIANGGTTTANADGSGASIASTIQANPTAGFSIVTYTGTGSAGSIAHGLSAAPAWIVLKKRTNDTQAWQVYHHKNTDAPETEKLSINTTAGTVDDHTTWNDQAPTSSVFYVGNASGTNESTDTFVAYCWTEIPGFSKFGSFIGSGNANGPMIYTDFKPAWVMWKRTNSTNQWNIHDAERNRMNPVNQTLYANVTGVGETAIITDFLSNGFKLRSSTAGSSNNDGSNYIYMAFAEHPFIGSGSKSPVTAR